MKFTDEPRAGIGESFVIQVNRVLGGQQNTKPKSARLLQHAKQGLFGWRVGSRWKIAVNLVHVKERAQGRGALLCPHPGFDGREKQCDKEHALAVGEVREIKDTVAGLALFGEKQVLNVERLPFAPGLKCRGGKDVVKRHCQRHTVFGREESINVECAQFFEIRLLGLMDQLFQVKTLPLAPVFFKNIGKQDVFARRNGVEVVHADQPKQGGDGAGNALTQDLTVGFPIQFRRGKR